MKSLTETVSWDSVVSAPTDSDPFGPGLFLIPLQTLTNRGAFLKSEASVLSTGISSLDAAVAGAADLTSLETRVSTEESANSSADTSLTTRASAEESARASADTSLETKVLPGATVATYGGGNTTNLSNCGTTLNNLISVLESVGYVTSSLIEA